ncbi:MAG: flagellar hook-length control protein FliK [Paracoccaceae bacterium]|nr:flagellar hook-length control protein FliK [Paracoccaceae bacterium]
MTEICSKGEAKFTEGLKGLGKNPDSEGEMGMFDALFGMISEAEIEIDPEAAVLSTDLTLQEKTNQNPELLANIITPISNPNESELNKISAPNLPKPNWVFQDASTDMETFKLTLEIKNNKDQNGKTSIDLLNKLAEALNKGVEIVPEKNKNPSVEQKGLKPVMIEIPSTKEANVNSDKEIIDNLLRRPLQSKKVISKTLNPNAEKEKNVELSKLSEQMTEKMPEKVFQLTKVHQSPPGKEMLKTDNAQNASMTNSNNNSSMSNNTNSGGNLGSGNSSHSNAPMVLEHLNMLERSWGKNLLNKVQTALQNGDQSIELALKPKNLGKLKIFLSLNNEGAKINIVTETSSAALLLAEAEGKLSQMLEGSGLKLSNLNTGTEQDKKGNPEQNNNEKDQNENQSGQKEAEKKEELEPSLELGSTTSLNQTVNLIA